MQEHIEGPHGFHELTRGLTAMINLHLWSFMARSPGFPLDLDCQSKVAERIKMFLGVCFFFKNVFMLRNGGVALLLLFESFSFAGSAASWPRCFRREMERPGQSSLWMNMQIPWRLHLIRTFRNVVFPCVHSQR